MNEQLLIRQAFEKLRELEARIKELEKRIIAAPTEKGGEDE